MSRQKEKTKIKWIGVVGLIAVIFLVGGCAKTAESCPPSSWVDLSGMAEYFEDDQTPFQFPLDDGDIFRSNLPFSTAFAAYGIITRGPEYHAAEDILQPAGTPVYAIADGIVSFSGTKGGYGWLVIVDHPQADIYSLYGHLSPSRWSIEKGASVQKGELIGYLGDSDENGGTPENPLRTHLHLGARVGQRADYPDNGQWRWMAGWVKLCPQDLDWLQPSLVIASQDIHYSESYQPTAGYLAKWWPDLLLVGVYLVGGGFTLVYAVRKDRNIFLFTYGILLIVAGIFLGMSISYLIYAMAVLLFAVGLYRHFRRPDKADLEESEK